jgi:sn1-specific diacylglycerol lipase
MWPVIVIFMPHRTRCALIVFVPSSRNRHGYLAQLLDDPSSKCYGYRLRIVGHSLGAGCALIVALMLRSRYPNLRCLCYSPPGCMVTKKLALSCKDFLMTYILNYDLVPRLSLETMLRLRNEVLDLIVRIKVPKYRILIAFLRRHREDLINDTLGNYLCDRDNVPDSQFKQQLDEFHQAQEERRTERGARSKIKLYAPGRIIHLVRTSKDEATTSPCCHKCRASCCCCCCGSPKPAYIPKYARCDDFKEIVVATSMGTDHFPNNLAQAIRELGETFGIDDSVCPSDESLIPSSFHDSLEDED